LTDRGTAEDAETGADGNGSTKKHKQNWKPGKGGGTGVQRTKRYPRGVLKLCCWGSQNGVLKKNHAGTGDNPTEVLDAMVGKLPP